MESGTAGVGGSSLVRRIRKALGSAGAGEDGSLARDIARLAGRLERLRQAFPDRPELLARVGLSVHVERFLADDCREPVAVAGGLVR